MRMRWVVRFLAVLGVGLSAWLAYPALRARVLAVEVTPAARGYQMAERLGCFACHGAAGLGGVANPGSEEGEVPAFVEQTQMMYVTGPDELREYVLDGAPARQLADPDYVARIERAALRMPAYRDVVSPAELDDLVAYLRAASGQLLPEDARAARGAALAAELDCFACHGPLGAGGVTNPGSFKGYVPGFWGADYDELVRDDGELRAWIADGRIDRIAEHPIGGRFFRGQSVKMPAYGRFISAEDVDALAAFVQWIRAGTWRAELG
jgi:mono/diheme cytochrome c family protein